MPPGPALGWGGERRPWTPTCCDPLPGCIRARPTDTHIPGSLEGVAGAESQVQLLGSWIPVLIYPAAPWGWGFWGMDGGLGVISVYHSFQLSVTYCPSLLRLLPPPCFLSTLPSSCALHSSCPFPLYYVPEGITSTSLRPPPSFFQEPRIEEPSREPASVPARGRHD